MNKNIKTQIIIGFAMKGVLVISIKDIVKQIISIAQIMIRQNLKNILLTLIWIIYIDMQWVNIYDMEDLNGLKIVRK